MTSRLIDPRMLTMLARDFFQTAGVIQQATETQDTTGAVRPAWTNVWTDIPCRVMPMGGGERRSIAQTYLDATDSALLAGNYAATEKMRFVAGGQNFDILNVEHDSEAVTTRLTLRVAR